VAPCKPSILLAPAETEGGDLECATVSLSAKGDYSWYSLDSTIESRLLPLSWPRVTYRTRSRGTEKRRREVLIGVREGKPSSSYRSDTSKGAPKGTRIWREPSYRDVPEGTVDMLSALFITRTLILEDLTEITFPLMQNDRVWLLTIRRGEGRRLKTKAGTFDVFDSQGLGVEYLHQLHAPGETDSQAHRPGRLRHQLLEIRCPD